MRKKLPILLLVLIILLQAFVPVAYAASKNDAQSQTAYFCPSDATSKGAGSVNSFLGKNVPQAYRADVKSAFEMDAKVTTTTQDITVYRYYGGSSGASSYWVTPNKYTNPSSKLALPPSNKAEFMQTYILPKGTQILEGSVAPQPQWNQTGGGYQYYVPDPSILIPVK